MGIHRLRRLLTAILALVAVVVVGCGGPAQQAAPPPTYTAAQLERIQQYIPNILENHGRISDLEAAVQAEDWQEAEALMGGPLTQMLQDMNNLSRNLLPQDQRQARELTRGLFEDFVGIKEAGELDNLPLAQRSYGAAIQDFNQFMELIPAGIDSAA